MNPNHLRDLEGQQYIGVRPVGAVMREFDGAQDAARQCLDDSTCPPSAPRRWMQSRGG